MSFRVARLIARAGRLERAALLAAAKLPGSPDGRGCLLIEGDSRQAKRARVLRQRADAAYAAARAAEGKARGMARSIAIKQNRAAGLPS